MTNNGIPISRWIAIASLSGGMSVLMGAFAAHVLEKRLDASMLDVFETAAEYQMYHSLGLLVASGLSVYGSGNSIRIARWSFLMGIIVFSGSLYALALSGIRWLGAITPIGGIAFLVGWITLAAGAWNINVPSKGVSHEQ